MKRLSDSLFEKIALHLSLVLASYLPHFWFVLNDLKPDVCNRGLYKTSLYFKGEDARIQDFKLEILTCCNSLIIDH
jgi:hypothetical protein